MDHYYATILAVLMALAWASPAAAQTDELEEDQVRGEVVDVSPDEELLRIRVEAVGDERFTAPGNVTTYRVPPDTEIEIGEQFSSLVVPLTPTLENLEEGQEVTLDFEEIEGEMVARDVAVVGRRGDAVAQERTGAAAGTADLAQADAVGPGEQRGRLPETASMLPMLALGGLGFAALALIIRVTRSR